MPHCDELVLHAPGECRYCDVYASDLQADRVAQGINFTGHSDPDKAQCPAEVRRPNAIINLWGGNRPATDF